MRVTQNYGYGRQGLPDVSSGGGTSALSYSQGIGEHDFGDVLFVPSSPAPVSRGTPSASFSSHLSGVPNGNVTFAI